MSEQMINAKKYCSIKYTLALLGIIFNLGFLFLILLSGISGIIQETILRITANSWLVTALYILTLGIIYQLLDFPLNFYRSFILEHRFNLTKQKLSDWFKDQLKTSIIGFIIGNILIQALYLLVNNFPQTWWIFTALFWILFSFVLAKVFPIVIIPLFFKYQPISDEKLKERIISLAQKFSIHSLNVFEIDFSKKTLKANAAFVGIGKTKRVILADTLKEKYSTEEIKSILAHEFAHFKFKHLLKLFVINSVSTLILFYLIYALAPWSLEKLGIFSLGEIQTLPLFLIFFSLFGLITAPLTNSVSCLFEKEADLACVKATGNKDAFISTMNKLAEQNLADRKPSWLIKIFFFDHPPIDERIEYVGMSDKA